MRILLTILYLLISISAAAQFPTPDFNIPTEVCLDEQFILENTSVNASNFEWDFCPNDFDFEPVELNNSNTFSTTFRGFKIVKDSGDYIGYGIGEDDALYRLEYGGDISSTPITTNLGNLGGWTDPEGLDLLKEGNKWIAIIGFLQEGGDFYRLIWEDLKGVPTVENLGNFGFIGRARDISLNVNGGERYLSFMEYSTSKLIRVKFGSSFENDVSSTVIYESVALSGVANPNSFDYIYNRDSLFLVVASQTSERLSLFNLDKNIENEPILVKSEIIAGLTNLENVKVFNVGSKVYGVLTSKFSSNIITLGNLETDPFSIVSYTQPIDNTYSFDVKYDSAKYYITTVSNGVSTYLFESNCSANTKYSTNTDPVLSYSSSGIKEVFLNAYNTDDVKASIAKEINVTNNQAPIGDIVLDPAYCIADNIGFIFNTSDDISTYNWDFGDGNKSVSISPTHQYVSAGEYFITLEVESTAGCPNIFYDTLNILPEPQSEFSTTKTEYCTFETIQFTNTTPYEYGSNINWSWSFNGEGGSSLENPEFTFETSGTKTISLEANVLGCIQSYQSTLTVINGPDPDFSYDANCFDEAIQFTNLSTGANITGYQWTFGDGQSSMAENPQHIYTNAGTYPVSLTVSNASGCENTTIKNIQIFDQIIDRIQSTKAVENLPFQLGVDWVNDFDSTQNLSYQWDIEASIQTTDTATYILPQGSYTINLEVIASNCLFSKQYPLVVIESRRPTVDFNLPPDVCIEEQFILENSSANASTYEWDFCPNDFDVEPVELNSSNTFSTIFRGFKIVKDSGEYIGYGIGEDDALYRLEYREDISSTPITTNLGNLGGWTDPEGLDLFQEGNKWIAIIGFLPEGGDFYRLIWEDLRGVPTVENIGNFGFTGRARDISLSSSGGERYLSFMEYSSSKLIRVKFGSSFENNVSSTVIYESLALSGVANPNSFDYIYKRDSLFLVVASQTSERISLFNLDKNIENEPTLVKSEVISGLVNLENISVFNVGSKVYGVLTSRFSSNIIALGNLETDPFSIVSYTQPIGNTYSFDVRYDSAQYYITTVSNGVSTYLFESNCSSSVNYSANSDPVISYSSSGTKEIFLTAYNIDNVKSSITKQITVSANQAPTGAILLDTVYCVADNINYTFDTEDDISTYNWDFGDGNSSTDISPNHQYASDGEYIIVLEVESAAGCLNIFYDTLRVLPEPQPEFSTLAAEYCTFEAIDFTNTTTFDFGENVVWSWDFNGEGSSSEENPSFTFETSGSKTISLEANVLGCVETYQSTLEIIEGPAPDFEYNQNCINDAIQFTNLSTGANITGYEWDFGNGENSTEENPQTIYSNAGNYTVELRVSNASGCETVITQSIRIFDQIVDSISASEATENLAFKLGLDWVNDFDSTQNLTYQWEINGEIQTTDTATYTLSQGTYTVKLEIITASNCIFRADRSIEVKPSKFPTADFSMPVEVCTGEQFILENSSANASTYEWDFCPNDFDVEPVELNSSNTFSTIFRGFKIVKDSGEYIGYGIGEDDALYRLEYREDISSTPITTNLGNLGGWTDPEGLDLFQEGNKWIAIIGFLPEGGDFYRLIWEDLRGVPTVENIGNFGFTGRARDISLSSSGGERYLSFMEYSSSKLIRVKFGSSFENNVSSTVIYESLALSGVANPNSFDYIYKRDSLFLVVASQTSERISLFNLDKNIENEPTLVKSEVISGLVNLENISVFNVGSKVYGVLTSRFSSNIIALGNLETDPFSIVSYTQPIGNTYSFDVRYDSAQYYITTVSNGVSTYLFESNCSSSVNYSANSNPVLSYSSSGTKEIFLTAYNIDNVKSSITKELTVSSNQAPDITFTTGANLCISNPIQFDSHSSTELSAYNWDFGDGQSSTEAAPSHIYAAAGTYPVTLSVSDTSGCHNLYVDSVRVYAEPLADFQATSQGSLCSQKTINFENLSNLPTAASFIWDFGDGNSSTEENPEHIYAAEGEYIVNLQIEMAGCLVEKTDTITVNPGPLVDFNFSDDCFGQVVNFENISTGAFLQSFQWNFGDGTQSTQTNPNHSYDSAGTYLVQLTALTSNGCDFTFQKEVEVSPVASVAFEAEVGCAEKPVQFTEQVALDQSNITDYLWDFGISGTNSDVSNLANPQFTFPVAGTYQVRLQVTTADGCTSTGTQSVSVNALPQPAFTYERNCLFNSILFSPENTNNIIAHFWELQNEAGEVLFTAQSENFSYAFEIPGNYQLRYRQQNENLCSNSVTQNVEILPLPEPDFQLGNICAGEAVLFENLTDLKGNTLKNYSWSIDGEIISSDLRPEYTFENSGEYLLSLQVETQSGCIQSISKPIIVSPTPIALFELEQTLAAYPYTLSLSADEYELSSIEYHEGTENRGQGTQTADRTNPVSTLGTKGLLGSKQLNLSTRQLANVLTYVWTLNEDTLSTTADVNHTIEQPGTYLLGLTITNEAGCTDSHYKQIRIREPNLDIALNNLRITQDQDFTGFVLNISNRGTLVPERLDLDIDLGSYSVTETIEEPLLPENNRNVALSIKLTAEQLRGLAKICIRAVPHNAAASESNVNNNRVCTNLESGLNIMDIYPNPVGTQFTLPMIIPDNGSVNLSLEQSNGQSVKTFKYDLEAGYNEIQIDRDNLGPGMYFLRIRFQGEEKVKKIIFQ